MEIKKICRVCMLADADLIPLFTADANSSPSNMIMICTDVKLTQNDGLPSRICKNCAYRLEISFQFKHQCENSDKMLRECLLNSMIDPMDIELKIESNIIKVEKLDELNLNVDVFPNASDIDDDYSNFDDIDFLSDSLNDAESLSYEKELEVKNQLDKSTKSSKPTVKKKTQSNNAAIERLKKLKSQKLKTPDKCLDCGKTFPYSGLLKKHRRIHTGERPFECDVCRKKFAQSGNLLLHKRLHTGEKPYQCEVCSKQFSSPSNLKSHIKSHTSERNYVCKECSQSFKTAVGLMSHAGTHTGIKNHVCKLCGKAFYKTNYLNVHIRVVHAGEKNYKCMDCGKEFTNSSNLTAHFRIHTGEKPFKCEFCKAAFNQSSALRRHVKQHLTPGKSKLS